MMHAGYRRFVILGAAVATAASTLAVGCGDDESGGGGSVAASTTATSAASGGGQASTSTGAGAAGAASGTGGATSASSGGGTSATSGGGGYTCAPEAGDSGCTTCLKTNCCNEEMDCAAVADPKCQCWVDCMIMQNNQYQKCFKAPGNCGPMSTQSQALVLCSQTKCAGCMQ